MNLRKPEMIEGKSRRRDAEVAEKTPHSLRPAPQRQSFRFELDFLAYSISKSIVSRRRTADSAIARQGEGNNDTIDLEMELASQRRRLFINKERQLLPRCVVLARCLVC